MDRMIGHWKTSLTGLGLAVILYVLNSWHCQLPGDASGWIQWFVPAAVGVLGLAAKDH